MCEESYFKMHLSQFFRLTVARIDERGQGQITFTDFEKLFEDDAVKASSGLEELP